MTKTIPLLLVVLLSTVCSSIVGASDVVVLTSSNFDAQTASGEWVVEFYAPWCGHCKKLVPIYEELATMLKGKVNVGKVDCTIEKDIQERFSIKGYPTLKLITGGKVYEYNEKDRTLPSLVAFAEGTYLRGTPNAVPPPKAKAEEKQAAPEQEVPKPAAPAQEGTGSDVVVLTQENFEKRTSSGEWLLEFYAPWCGHCKNLVPTYEKLATSLKGKYNVAKIDCTTEEGLRDRFNIRGFPTIKFLKEGKVYDYAGARTEAAFTTFVESGYKTAVNNDLPPAQPAPAKEAAAGTKSAGGKSDVVVLTEKNFDEKTASGKWLVEFYAPWCGHCQRLAPTYEKLATSLVGEVNVAKIDCTVEKSKCSQHEIRGYPSIYYFQDGLRYKYSGERTINAFQNFVRGGYKSASGEDLPVPPGMLKALIADIVRFVEGILEVNIFLVIAACVGFGLILGILIILIAAPGKQPTQPRTTRRTPTTTTTATTTTTTSDGTTIASADDDDDDHPKQE